MAEKTISLLRRHWANLSLKIKRLTTRLTWKDQQDISRKLSAFTHCKFVVDSVHIRDLILETSLGGMLHFQKQLSPKSKETCQATSAHIRDIWIQDTQSSLYFFDFLYEQNYESLFPSGFSQRLRSNAIRAFLKQHRSSYKALEVTIRRADYLLRSTLTTKIILHFKSLCKFQRLQKLQPSSYAACPICCHNAVDTYIGGCRCTRARLVCSACASKFERCPYCRERCGMYVIKITSTYATSPELFNSSSFLLHCAKFVQCSTYSTAES